MSTQSNHFARKTTALLGGIAASSLLGLPALAGGLNRDAINILDQAQAQSGSNQLQCTPITQSNGASSSSASSNSATSTSSIATPDASASGAAQVPNQADPRTGATSSDQVVGSNTDGSTASASTNANASSNQANNAYTSNAGNQNASNQNSAYGDVLSQGGATSGGFASQQVAAANNPDGYRTVSSRYSSNEQRSNFGNYGNNDSAMGNTSGNLNSSNSMRSDSMSQSSNQSSQMTTGTTIAQCPAGTIPQSSNSQNRQTPDQLNQGVQTSPQSTDSQTRQSPADDNSGRAR